MYRRQDRMLCCAVQCIPRCCSAAAATFSYFKVRQRDQKAKQESDHILHATEKCKSETFPQRRKAFRFDQGACLSRKSDFETWHSGSCQHGRNRALQCDSRESERRFPFFYSTLWRNLTSVIETAAVAVQSVRRCCSQDKDERESRASKTKAQHRRHLTRLFIWHRHPWFDAASQVPRSSDLDPHQRSSNSR